MPTARPRHFVTETDELSVALDEAARQWPALSRPQLLVRLALEGQGAVRRAHDEHLQARRKAIKRLSGSLSGAYTDNHLDEVRDGWPE